MTIVEVDRLTKSYGAGPVLRGVSFRVGAGEIFGLLGANGAGKTTAVEIIQGLRTADSGTVRILGVDPTHQRARLRRVVGSQLQSSALPDRLRVGESLRLFARLAGNVVDWRELSAEWDLDPLERRPFGALSGGERQRLFIALALVNQPRVVFLDELTQGLDAGARRDTWRLVEQVRDRGATVILVTHFMDEAERLCDRLAVLHDGRIVAEGSPSQLVADVGGPVHVRFSADGRHTDIPCRPTDTVGVIADLARAGLAPDDLTIVRPSLEDAFVALTRPSTAPVASTPIGASV